MPVPLPNLFEPFASFSEGNVEAVLLVGGAGSRLRPLTISTPKPMLPVANFPCTAHQIAKAKAAGITRIILSTSYKAEVFEGYFQAGEKFGVEIVYVTEESPLGTGGAIRNVASSLNSLAAAPIVILNGDILSGHDIAKQVAEFESAQADVSLHLINVEDPRPFGLVPTDESGNVLSFLEKPQTPEEIVTHQINAGCYVFRRSVIDSIPPNQVVSVERETFPSLLQKSAKVVGYIEDAYWLDLGNPLAFAQGSRDLVLGKGRSPLIANVGEALVADSASVHPTAEISGGSAIGENVVIKAGAKVIGSVVMNGAEIGESAIILNSIISCDANIGSSCNLRETVVADSAIIGAENEFSENRIWPNVVIPKHSIRFSS
jgi:mannose-1-phosphate guanylyltransferase